MSSSVKTILVILMVSIAATYFSYQNFAKYKPKKLMPVEEVHGTKTQFTISVPYPNDHIILGTSSSENTKSITFKTTQSPEQIQNFYKNILTEDGWEIDTENESGIFSNVEYKRGKDKVKVTTSAEKNANATIVGIDITQKN